MEFFHPVPFLVGARIATQYSNWLQTGRSGIESQWGQDFSHMSRPALRPTQPPEQWVLGLSRSKNSWGMVLTTHPLLAPRSQMSRAVTVYLYFYHFW
jgi:hypothetical protein